MIRARPRTVGRTPDALEHADAPDLLTAVRTDLNKPCLKVVHLEGHVTYPELIRWAGR
jgi:hypothetical protein